MTFHHIPNYLILDTRSFVKYLRSKINNLSNFNADEHKIFSLIFDAISIDNNAMMELEYESMAIMRDSIGMYYDVDVEVIINAMIKFGTIMHEYLKRINAYKNGILLLKYDRMINDDIVLKKIYED